jgi:putative heme iron utilization protein
MTDPIRPTDADAISLAQDLLAKARWASLGTLGDDGHPMVTRIGFACLAGTLVSLVSDLSAHSTALRRDARCALMVGEVAARGDPLNQPRLSLKARAQFISRDSAEHGEMAALYLSDHPKARLYIGFTDFSFLRFDILSAALNGGFGKAYLLTREDLARSP